MTKKLSRPSLLLLAAAIATIGLAGCNKDKDQPPASQAAVRINGDEISANQVNAVLAKLPQVPPELSDKARHEILDKLIDQQLAVQQAIDKKLDRSPDVMTAIEAARREILARAYLEQVVAAQAKPGVDEAKKYYAEHPQLFAQRRVYQLQELMIPAQGAPVDKLREMAAGKSIEQIADWLKQQNIKFQANAVVRPAEQVGLDVLGKLHEMKDGQMAVLTAPQAVSVVRIAASQPAPIDEASALPRIQQFLANQRNGEAIAADLKKLKEKAKIEYVGDFAKAAPSPAAPGADGLAPPSSNKTDAAVK
jgi:EpsD family peptidyl-prolyl cis-trans isomerase